MHIGKNYTLQEFIVWTRRDIYLIILFATIPTALFQLLEWTWLGIPWIPVALVGTAAAFIVGFRNTQTYSRLWEARQIYGGIVNSSRTWGIYVTSYVHLDDKQIRALIDRHIAWMTALRFQLRQKKEWELHGTRAFEEYKNHYTVQEWVTNIEDELAKHLSPEDLKHVLLKKNRATQLIALQSHQLKEIRKAGIIGEFEHYEMENVLSSLLEHQGKAERIKNFPYPRQFASINNFFTWLFILILPFGLLNEFAKLGEYFAWIVIPFSLVVSWVFISMERVGQATENPFEGGANDVPITSMSRTIEIDLLEMINEENLPEAIQAENKIML